MGDSAEERDLIGVSGNGTIGSQDRGSNYGLYQETRDLQLSDLGILLEDLEIIELETALEKQ